MLDKSDPVRGLFAVVLSLLLVTLAGRLMIVGKSFLLPIVIALISVYVLTAASDALRRLPVTRRLPNWALRIFVLAGFLIVTIWFGSVMVSTAGEVSVRLPGYQENIERLYAELTALIGIEAGPDLRQFFEGLREAIPIRQIAGTLLGSISSAAGLLFMIVVYATFLMSERNGFAHKITVALPGRRAERAGRIIANINNAISEYIAVKTLVNVILGALSFVAMWAIGIDFALFWAILIALLNYIPYVGSMLGVFFPVVLSMAQFGSVEKTLVILALLAFAQMWVGNVLEPRMVGRRVNMSPFVVLVALALWSSVWGLAGAVLAIPLTSIIAIIMASFESTRPFAVLIAEDVTPFEPQDQPNIYGSGKPETVILQKENQ
ncbi:AI-2E family transporter [Paracoccus aerodenitrificans]|uniref:AI-2E family transporter n=1 Tax=Paracoccus aerodenitrificans TaxID=3017781 RepID=UPI0022F01023|nr:AI-2E family transporter [Paracoccus aerodenitrificans]WBU63029.1 AI-2E family transporter [Paracoccus aerodenitrificans]